MTGMPEADGDDEVIYLLYPQVPASLGAALRMSGNPDVERLPFSGAPVVLPVGGIEVMASAHVSPLQPTMLDSDLRVSPMRERLTPLVEHHAARLRLEGHGPDALAAMQTLTRVAAAGLSSQPGTVIWIPSQSRVTTDVLFLHDLDTRPERALFGVHAGQFAPGVSFAFTRGLDVYGGTDVFAELPVDPAIAFDALGDAVGRLLGQGRLPRAGEPFEVAGVPAVLALEPDPVRMAPTLRYRLGPAPQPKKKGWFRR